MISYESYMYKVFLINILLINKLSVKTKIKECYLLYKGSVTFKSFITVVQYLYQSYNFMVENI